MLNRLRDLMAPPRPLPASLATRLRGIPEREVVCRDVDRLVEAMRRKARGGPVDLAVDRHLAGCARCARIYGILHAAFATLPLPLPEALRGRLERAALWRRVRLPWLADARLILAASLILSVLLTPVTAGAAARARATDAAVYDTAAEWLADRRRAGRSLWRTAEDRAERGLTAGAEVLDRYFASWYDLIDRSRRVLDPASPLPRSEPPNQTDDPRGDDDGRRDDPTS